MLIQPPHRFKGTTIGTFLKARIMLKRLPLLEVEEEAAAVLLKER